jgi:hypothetical protein
MQEAVLRIDLAAEALQFRGGAGLARQEGGQVARDGCVLRVRQADLGQAGAGSSRR